MSGHPGVRRLRWAPEALTIDWSDGAVVQHAAIWLRDNARETRNPDNGQRLIDVTDLPEAPRIESAALGEGVLSIGWQDGAPSSTLALAWLAAHRSPESDAQRDVQPLPWLDGGALEALRDCAWAAVGELDDPVRRCAWLTRLLRSGIAFLHGLPASEHALLDAMGRIGRVCATNYGEVFDVRSVHDPENLAYTDLGLGLHTDNPYREPVPGFQALHALATAPDGGDSLFADGFALAEHFRRIDPGSFAVLAHTPVPFAYRSANADLHAEHPLIEVSGRGAVLAVHYNNRSIAPLRTDLASTVEFYAAYRRFAALLKDPRHPLRFRLRDGDLVVFDNRRILHGRTAFSAARHPRHLRGCYLTRDSVYSEAALLRRGRDPAPC